MNAAVRRGIPQGCDAFDCLVVPGAKFATGGYGSLADYRRIVPVA